MGHPTKRYDEKVADQICEIIASSNKALATILKENPTFPKVTTVYKWLNENEDFAKNYARAKEEQADFMAEEIIEIADDSSKDTIEGEYGPIENKEWVNRSKLRIDARKWLASKLKAKKYGDKLELDGKVDQTTEVIIVGKKFANEDYANR